MQTPTQEPIAPKKAKSRGLFGLVGVLGLLALKFKSAIFLAFKSGWLLQSFGTMFLSMAFYIAMFGWSYAALIIVSLIIHESGHWLLMQMLGFKPKPIVFLPGLGAYTTMTKLPADQGTHAWVAYAGPFAGAVGALAIFWASANMDIPKTSLFGVLTIDNKLLLAGANFGFMINLFQLIPAKPFDGGFIVSAISKWFLIPGVIALGLLALAAHSFMMGLIAIVAVFALIGQFKNKVQVQSPATALQKFFIGVAYIGLVLVLGCAYSYSGYQISEHMQEDDTMLTGGIHKRQQMPEQSN